MNKVAGFCLLFFIILQVFTEASSSFSDHQYATNSISNVDGRHETVHHTGGHSHPVGNTKSLNITCEYACKRRCKKSSRQKICKRACRSCCLKCRCVPPGYAGNNNSCPCYARLTTHGGRPKCP